MFKKTSVFILILLTVLIQAAHAAIDTSNSIMLEPNTCIEGKIRYQSQKNVYKIKTPSKGPVKLEFEYPKDAPKEAWRMIILSATYQIINEKTSFSDIITDNSRTHITKQCRLPAGTFYVIICGFRNYDTSPYKLKVVHTSEAGLNTETEFKNSTPFGTPVLNTNTVYKGNISNEFDIDYFCIKKPENGSFLTTSILPENENDLWHIELYDKKLNKIASTDFCGEDVMKLDISDYEYDLVFFKVTKGLTYTNNDYNISFNVK